MYVYVCLQVVLKVINASPIVLSSSGDKELFTRILIGTIIFQLYITTPDIIYLHIPINCLLQFNTITTEIIILLKCAFFKQPCEGCTSIHT